MTIDLIFADETRTLTLGDDRTEIRRAWAADETEETFIRPDTFVRFVSYQKLGVQLTFVDDALESVLLFIADKENPLGIFKHAHGKFAGTCSYLGKPFWAAPTLETFEFSLGAQGFEKVEPKKSYVSQYVKDDLNVALYGREGRATIGFSKR